LLRVVKSNPGEGSTFRVFIPALAKSHSTPDKPKRQKSLSIDTERILIIDDEPLLVQINKRLLEDYGYTVTVIGITDSREALEKVRAEPKQFDLIITDQTMPRLSGSELALAVLEIAPDMPIITAPDIVRSPQQKMLMPWVSRDMPTNP
jgi:two-component system cell cycle sensor histidine kinase/response regulator CckA